MLVGSEAAPVPGAFFFNAYATPPPINPAPATEPTTAPAMHPDPQMALGSVSRLPTEPTPKSEPGYNAAVSGSQEVVLDMKLYFASISAALSEVMNSKSTIRLPIFIELTCRYEASSTSLRSVVSACLSSASFV